MSGPRDDRLATGPGPTGSGGEALAARLRELARLLPEGATVSLDARALQVLAGPEQRDLGGADIGVDLTVKQAASRLQLSENHVRTLIGEQKLGAYRIAGRGGWRITTAALADFRQAGQLAPPAPVVAPVDRVDIGRWRNVRRGKAREAGKGDAGVERGEAE